MNAQQARDYRAEKLTKRHTVYGPRADMPGCKDARWVEHASRGLRFVGYADEIVRSLQHRGWYQNDEGDDWPGPMRGVVYRLPHGRFAYGYADPNNEDCALLCFDNDAETAEVAALYADRIAELCAVRERDYQRKWHAAERVRALRELIRTARRDHTALLGATWSGTGRTGERMRLRCRETAHEAITELRAVLKEYGHELSEFH